MLKYIFLHGEVSLRMSKGQPIQIGGPHARQFIRGEIDFTDFIDFVVCDTRARGLTDIHTRIMEELKHGE